MHNSFTHHVFTGRASTHRGQDSCLFFKEKKHCSLSAIVCWTGKCDGNDQGYSFFFPPETFSTDNSFHGRLASDLGLSLSLFNLGGGVAAEE